jgi:hypothetical protein
MSIFIASCASARFSARSIPFTSRSRSRAQSAPSWARSAVLSSDRNIHRNRVSTTGKAIGLIIGLSYQVTVVFAESLLPSDRGFSYQVTVDKSAYPKALPTVALMSPLGGPIRVTKMIADFRCGIWAA